MLYKLWGSLKQKKKSRLFAEPLKSFMLTVERNPRRFDCEQVFISPYASSYRVKDKYTKESWWVNRTNDCDSSVTLNIVSTKSGKYEWISLSDFDVMLEGITKIVSEHHLKRKQRVLDRKSSAELNRLTNIYCEIPNEKE